MKRTLSLFVVVILCLGTLVSCGKPYNLDFTKYQTLGTYKGVEVSKSKIEENLQNTLDSVLEGNASYVEISGAAAEGNRITYSFTGTVDGVAYDALVGESRTTTAVSGTTGYTELDEALPGMKAGETTTVEVTLPENFSADAELSGKQAVLTITVNKVEELVTPDTLTDEMVSEYTGELYTTIDAYKTYLYSAIKQSLVWSTIMNNTTFKDYPKKEAEKYYEQYLANYQAQSAQYGMTLEQLASLSGITMDALQANLAQQAVNKTYQDMVMYDIARRENIAPDKARVAAEAETIAKENGFSDVKSMYAQVGEDEITAFVQYIMVLEFVEANAVEID